MDVPRELRQRRDQLLDPAVRGEAALVEDDAGGRGQGQRVVEAPRPLGGGSRRYEQFMTIAGAAARTASGMTSA